MLDETVNSFSQTDRYNTSATLQFDCCPKCRRLGWLGLCFPFSNRELEELKRTHKFFRITGNEIAWVSIGNASTAEGPFWEAVQRYRCPESPAIITIYDERIWHFRTKRIPNGQRKYLVLFCKVSNAMLVG